MNNTTKNILFIGGGLVLGLILGFIVFGGRQAPVPMGGPSAAGAIQGDVKVAQQNFLSTSTTTIYSLFNDGTDRVIEGARMFATGMTAGTSTNFAITCGTSTTAYGFTPANVLKTLDVTLGPVGANASFGSTTIASQQLGTGESPVNIATSSPGSMGTTTASVLPPNPQLLASRARIWPSQTYMVCQVTGSGGATTISWATSTITGYIGFPYLSQ